MTRVGLHMIVRNEAAVIERCLHSVRPYIDWWVVSDTGSVDGTQDLVRSCLADLPGELLERPWVSFGHNRQEALEAARSLPAARPGDYALWIDADEELVDGPGRFGDLSEDGYRLTVHYANQRYSRLALVRLHRPWQWVGAIHEHLELPGAQTGAIDGPVVLSRHEGARSRDPETYRRDAELIETELEQDADDPRLQFYVAQSWRDAGEHERALVAYQRRAANERGWDEERWYAAFQAAVCRELLGRPADEVVAAYLEAWNARPGRAEPLIEAARIERTRQRFSVALLYAQAARDIAQPDRDALFVDRDAYAWRAADEVAISCYWLGRWEQGREAARAALAARPDDPRLRENLGWFGEGPDEPNAAP